MSGNEDTMASNGAGGGGDPSREKHGNHVCEGNGGKKGQAAVANPVPHRVPKKAAEVKEEEPSQVQVKREQQQVQRPDQKRHQQQQQQGPAQGGTEDECETHTFPNASFRLEKRLRPERIVGYGAYGVVCAAKDTISQRRVAIKKIASAFQLPEMTKRTLRELRFLKHFHSHKNIISVLTILKPPADLSRFHDIYVVMELQETNLHRIIHSKQPLSEEHVRYFMFQLLSGLQYIHAARVLHRDIKPGNLLINSDCSLKICDFGMARALASTPEEHAGFMTAYVATRWYRAPEVMLSFHRYTQAIDVWSAACVLGEMLGRRYLFPGQDYTHQLVLILTLLGTPTQEIMERIGSDLARKYVASLPKLDPVPLRDVYKDASDDVLDLLAQMLRFDPDARLTVAHALQHRFFTKYSQQVPAAPPTVSAFDFEYENRATRPEELKKMIVDEVMEYHTPGTTAYRNAQFALAKRTVVRRTSATGDAGSGPTPAPAPAPAPAAAAAAVSGVRAAAAAGGQAAAGRREGGAAGRRLSSRDQLRAMLQSTRAHGSHCGDNGVSADGADVADGNGGNGSCSPSARGATARRSHGLFALHRHAQMQQQQQQQQQQQRGGAAAFTPSSSAVVLTTSQSSQRPTQAVASVTAVADRLTAGATLHHSGNFQPTAHQQQQHLDTHAHASAAPAATPAGKRTADEAAGATVNADAHDSIADGPKPKKKKGRRPLNKTLHPDPTPETRASLAEFRRRYIRGQVSPADSKQQPQQQQQPPPQRPRHYHPQHQAPQQVPGSQGFIIGSVYAHPPVGMPEQLQQHTQHQQQQQPSGVYAAQHGNLAQQQHYSRTTVRVPTTTDAAGAALTTSPLNAPAQYTTAAPTYPPSSHAASLATTTTPTQALSAGFEVLHGAPPRFSPLFDTGDLGSPGLPSARNIADLASASLGLGSAWSPSALNLLDVPVDPAELQQELMHGSASIFPRDPRVQMPPPGDEPS